MVRTSHGMLPNPAPAVVELLQDVPTVGRDYAVELTTPTGASIIAALTSSFGPLPAMRIMATGFGAGSRELDDMPNCTQVVVGTEPRPGGTATEGSDDLGGQPVALLECNVDDATGETLAHAVARLIDAGAHDAWITPIVAKKGRPGHVVSVLCDVASSAYLRPLLQLETGSFGVRGRIVERWPSERIHDAVQVEGMPVRVKVSPGRVKVEHDDAARVALHRGLALREVVYRAEVAWRREQRSDAGAKSSSDDANLGASGGSGDDVDESGPGDRPPEPGPA